MYSNTITLAPSVVQGTSYHAINKAIILSSVRLYVPYGHYTQCSIPTVLTKMFVFSGTPVGLIFSSEYIPEVDVIPRKFEIGWHLDSCVWGKGYATEAAKALIDQIKETGLTRLYAVVDQANPKSLAVCERLNMTKVGITEEWYGKPLLEYVIELK